MKPLTLPAVELPPRNIRYPSQWSDGSIEIYSQLPKAMLTPFEHHLKRCGWEQNSDAVTLYPADITIVNGSAFVHTDDDYGIMAITLIDSGGETELITRHGGTRMTVGDVVVFDTDKWHAWISHGPCALAGICVRRITPPTTTEEN
jgi:hypothetical protein